MSQAGDLSAISGPVPPAVATSYVTDVNSPAIPAANVLDVFGGETTSNNTNGIRTDGSSGSNVLTVQLTNRATGTATTSDGAGQSQTAITFALGATPGVYQFNIEVVGFDALGPAGVGYAIFGTVRTSGVGGVTIGSPTKVVNEEASLVTADSDVSISANNVLVTVDGVAGRTMKWFALLTYIFVS